MSLTRARRLRQDGNLPESRAWALLRGLRSNGFPVRRQHPIGRDIVGFAVLRARHVAQGWRMLRIAAADVFSADVFLARVQRALGPIE